jgi:hypothetical protein
VGAGAEKPPLILGGRKMAVVETRFVTGTAANGGEFYLYITWDSKLEQEDGTFLDPNATGLVSSIRYKNMGAIPKTIALGNKTYSAPALTPETVLNIPSGQRPNLYDSVPQIY